MNKVRAALPSIVRTLLGLFFLVFGLNGFLQFLPAPPLPEPATRLFGAFIESGYLFQFIKGTEVVVALLLLSNRFVPLALTVLAPIVLNIVAFHIFLTPFNPVMAAWLIGSMLYLAYAYRDAFRGVLQANAKPAPVEPAPEPAIA